MHQGDPIFTTDDGDFPTDLFVARQRFQSLAADLGMVQSSIESSVDPKSSRPLTIDFAYDDPAGNHPARERLILITGGLHGVEGPLGSQLQMDAMRLFARGNGPVPTIACIHSLNPFGFWQHRRAAADNVDLNRNWLSDPEDYRGCDPMYAKLDPILNPKTSRVDCFAAKAIGRLIWHGPRQLRTAIAMGQYDFPEGLFYGGSSASPIQSSIRSAVGQIVNEIRPRHIVHLDLHSGLGSFGSLTPLLELPPTPKQIQQLSRWFGPNAAIGAGQSTIAYQPNGSFGGWMGHQSLAPDYLYVCMEYGTYRPLKMLSALRRENQTHHLCRGQPEDIAAKERLQNAFVPRSRKWQNRVRTSFLNTIRRIIADEVPNPPCI